VTTFAASNIARIDLDYKRFSDWRFPQGIRNIMELTEPEFLYHASLLDLKQLEQRRQPARRAGRSWGFLDIEMLGGRHVFLKILAIEELPRIACRESTPFSPRRVCPSGCKSGGLAIVNLATWCASQFILVYPEVPTDAWSADEESGPRQ